MASRKARTRGWRTPYASRVREVAVPFAVALAGVVGFALFDADNDARARRAGVERTQVVSGSKGVLADARTLRLELFEYRFVESSERAGRLKRDVIKLAVRLDTLARGPLSQLIETDPLAQEAYEAARDGLASAGATMTSVGRNPDAIDDADATLRVVLRELERFSASAMQHGLELEAEERRRLKIDSDVSLGAVVAALFAVLIGLIAVIAQNRRLAEARAKARTKSDELHVLAHYDVLTGLPNRGYGYELGRAMIARATARGAHVAALCIDVDRFKQINDAFGHGAGDDLLRHIGELLGAIVAAGSDMVASRVGGDEFWIARILESPDSGDAWADAVTTALRCERSLDGHRVTIAVSGGLAVERADRVALDALLREADMALRAAKARGRGRTAHYEPQFAQDRHRRLTLEEALPGAARRGELVQDYQPVIAARDGTTDCVEAIVGWAHPTLGSVSLEEFGPVAEDIGASATIGEWSLRRACADAAAVPGLRVSVCLSVAQMSRPDVAARIRAALDDCGLSPDRLTLQIKQAALSADEDAARRLIDEMREQGVGVVLAGFGADQSSPAYLRRFNVSGLKLDPELVAGLDVDAKARTLLRATIGIARALSLRVTAGGVDRQFQAAALAVEGCDAIQGGFVAAPMSLDQLRGWLARPESRRAAVG